MTKLSPKAMLDYASAVVTVLRTLDASGCHVTYGQLARLIGLIGPDEKWQAWHRQQITDILNLASAADPDEKTIRFELVVAEKTEAPGAGFHRSTKLVRSQPIPGFYDDV